jgi:tetratricopeptide (TPR) repeat protein
MAALRKGLDQLDRGEGIPHQKLRTLFIRKFWPRTWLGFALIENGKYDEAISAIGQVSPESPTGVMSLVVLGYAYGKQSKRAEAEQQISRLRDLAKTRYLRSYFLAYIHAALGDKDKAFAELEQSFSERDFFLGRLPIDPAMDPLRDDPRFKGLLKRMNL